MFTQRLASLLAVILGCAALVACASKNKADFVVPPIASTAAAPTVPPILQDVRQLTFAGARAGEGYFSQDGRFLIFQSEREGSNPFYQIYLTDRKTGLTKRISPGAGKTTCAWIHPDSKKVIFASTHADPKLKEKVEQELADRKAPKKRYNWSFDDAYEIYEADINGANLRNLTRSAGYDAEGSYSPDGQWIAFASNRAAFDGSMTPEQAAIFARDASYMMDLYIMKADGTQLRRLTTHLGYDGGPFFSPDGKRITFRRFSPDGHTAEIFTIASDGTDERQITRMGKMSWAPFYHPSGEYLVFTSNKEGYSNFELYIVDVNGSKTPVRVTSWPGFDGLPVFSPDGDELVWAHTGDDGSTQLYSARWNDDEARLSLDLPPTNSLKPVVDLVEVPDVRDIEHWVKYLSSEKFGGRPSGGPTEKEYSQAIANYFKSLGLKPANGKSFLQPYEFTNGVRLQEGNSLGMQIAGDQQSPKVGEDWTPLSYSKTGIFSNAPLVFAGYGIVAPPVGEQTGYDSYAGLDVKGKWVLVFSGIPEDIPNQRRYHLNLYSRIQHKAMMARQHGALGLILIADARTPSPSMDLVFEGRGEDAGLPVLRLSDKLADQIMKAAATTRKLWTERLAKGEIANLALPQVTANATVKMQMVKSQSANIVARLDAGEPSSIMIGAHLDHLGRGEGGTSLSREKNQIHFGADDNASGVAAVLAIAKDLSTKRKRGKLKLKQNILFALWTGEEIGILGSNHYAKTSKAKITAYLNMDMVGRLRDKLIVQGIGSAKEWPLLVEQVNLRQEMNLTTQTDPYLPTDALAFYLKKVPSISAFTGAHAEYHTDKDTPDLINYPGLAKVANWVGNMAVTLAQSSRPLVRYQRSQGPRPDDQNRSFRLYLGTVPDYSQEGKAGVLISGTNKDSPAEKAGLVPGDVIVELGGMKVRNLQDYVYCLQALKAGEKTVMRVLRAGNEKQLEITPVLKSQR